MSIRKIVGASVGVALTAGVVSVAAPSAAQAATSEARVVCKVAAGDKLNVRTGPGSKYRVVNKVNNGLRLSGTKTSNGWFQLAQPQRFISYAFTCPAAAPAPAPAPAPKPAPPKTTYLMLQPTGTNGSPTSPFGMRVHPITKVRKLHNGVDIGDKYGAAIRAASDGTVRAAGYSSSAGNRTEIYHGKVGSFSGVSTVYMHQSRIVVRAGQHVTKGQVIGYVGSTGSSTKPHLHFSVKQNGSYVNPVTFIGPLNKLAR